MVATENIHRAEFIAKSKALSELNTPAVAVIARILDDGRRSGAFLRDVDAIDAHMHCFFRVSTGTPSAPSLAWTCSTRPP